MIIIKNLTIQSSPSRRIIHDANLNFKKGALHAIVGPNGSGKTTLLRSIAGLIPLSDHSSIRIDDKNLASLNNFERAELISYIESQHIAPFAYTVRDIVLWGRWAKHKGQPTIADHEATALSASMMGIDKMLDRPFNELSTGERKKALIAQSLASQSRCYVWDEPLAPLDLKATSDVLRIAKDLAFQGSTLLVSFHDISLALRHADTVTVIDNGRIAWTGKSQDPGIAKHIETTFGVKTHHGGVYFS
jgi:iron complex transport system ATP-binding protein